MSEEPLGRVDVDVADVEQASSIAARVFHPHRMRSTEPGGAFGMRLHAVSMGPITLGTLEFDNGVLVSTPPMEDAYEVNFVRSGRMRAYCGQSRAEVDPACATVLGPDRPTGFTVGRPETPLVGVKIERRALEGELARLLDRAVDGPLDFAVTLDIAHGTGAQWLRLIRVLEELAAGDPDPWAHQRIITAPLVRGVLTGLLAAGTHRYREQPERPAAPAGTGTVRRACAHIEEHAHEALTTDTIASAVSIGVRALQLAFRKDLGMTPMEYVHQVRLGRAHRELQLSDPLSATVAAVAARWGFTHTGRFAARYRVRYGRSPSETLRG